MDGGMSFHDIKYPFYDSGIALLLIADDRFIGTIRSIMTRLGFLKKCFGVV